jgi:hypothetical protein
MNLLRALGLRREPQRSAWSLLRGRLPEINSFVDVAVGGATKRESVAVNGLGPSELVTRCPDGMQAGASADFLYSNALGRFRFSTLCTVVHDKEAHFEIPQSIKMLENYDRRNAARVSWIIPVQWRYAPGGEGFGDYLPGSMMDLSCGGAGVVVSPELKIGTQVEVRFTLKIKNTLFIGLCEVMRSVKIEKSQKNATGIRFLQIDPGEEQALVEFLNERRMTRRDRGIV